MLLCLLASLGVLVWAVTRSVQKRRSRWQYSSAAGLFVGSIVFTSFLPPSQKVDKPARGTTSVRSSAKLVTLAARNPELRVAPTPAPAPTRDYSQERTKIREGWSKVLARTVAAERAMRAAQGYISRGNAIDASASFKECEEAASGIKQDSATLPDKIDELIYANIYKVGDGLGYGCKSLRSYLDSGAPSDAADAKSRLNGVQDAIDTAAHQLRQKYVELGGKRADIEGLRTAAPELFKR